ncbi:oligosaccharide flippase family protein [Saprospiraceae bacterium]|nr:oligosaccharide flippase family protein [Saprospiraceae bacterium]
MLKKYRSLVGQRGSFKRNALLMSGGAAANVIVSLGLYPIVTRLFTKEDFGLFGIYGAIVSTLLMMATWLYPSAFVIPKLKREFYALLKLALYLTLIAIFISLLLIFFGRSFLDFFFRSESLGNLIYLIPVGILLSSFLDIFTNWNVRNKLFKSNAVASIGSAVTMKSSNILFGAIMGSSAIGLIVSQFISTVTNIYLLGFRKLAPKILIISRISKAEVFSIAKKYKKYPLNLLPGNLVNKYTSDLPIYLLTAYFNPAITGAFVLANQMMKVPLNVIGRSISSVFIQKSNELYLIDPESISTFTLKINKKMLIIASLAFGFLFGFGDVAFGFVFGKQWLDAGKIATILSLYYVLQSVSAPLSGIFRVTGNERYALYVSILLAILRTLGMYLGVMSGNVFTAILYFTIGNMVGYFVTMILIFISINISIFKSGLQTLLIVGVVFLAFYLLREFVDEFVDLRKVLKLH